MDHNYFCFWNWQTLLLLSVGFLGQDFVMSCHVTNLFNIEYKIIYGFSYNCIWRVNASFNIFHMLFVVEQKWEDIYEQLCQFYFFVNNFLIHIVVIQGQLLEVQAYINIVKFNFSIITNVSLSLKMFWCSDKNLFF